MRYEYLEQVMEWSERICQEMSMKTALKDVQSRTFTSKHLLFRAFAATGWTLWSRNFETAALKRKHYIPNAQGPWGAKPFFKLELVDRKGWQRKNQKDRNGAVEHDLEGNTYHIYDQPSLPSANVYHYLPVWIEYLEMAHYGRPLTDEDYLFPMIGANGIIQPHLPISHNVVQLWLGEFTKEAGITELYRFMFAPPSDRWTLARVRWGGWAKVTLPQWDTLIRYLLDELYMYEESHADALQPPSELADFDILGAAASSVSESNFRNSLLSIREDLTSVMSNVVSNFLSRQQANTHRSLCMRALTLCHAVVSPSMAVMTFSARGPQIEASPTSSYMQDPARFMPPLMAAPAASPQPQAPEYSMPPHDVCVLNVPIPRAGQHVKSESWCDIVELWETGIPNRGTLVLRNWPKDWLMGENKSRFAAKYHQRRVIAEEYLVK
ncbi:hypothetical protein SCP_1701820 [Sparassis crispa]|uniref:Uncharacterized protein n=1 Tax=Sparassis crispa TaxID=139825 RepID=A0A401H5Z0_9APHY|nr:hypothetical protein SCP_1701820 [Sparassis crispa]GBE89856.1 hypothetical protein SCP_1701820 [Sparassis crispa]